MTRDKRVKNRESSITESLLTEVGEFISVHMGLHFPENRRNDLERGLRSAAPELGFEDPEACTRWLISSPITKSTIEVLANHLTVGETYFFRDRRCFDFLEEKVFPELIGRRRTSGKYLRIWSAGCCTGEEPYSAAILLNRMISDIKDWNITVLATDINPVFLRKASAGLYGDWSFRDAPKWIRERYFRKTKGNHSELLPEMRKQVIFTYHNLAEDAYPALYNNTNAMDLILCRNVLMYSTSDHQRYMAKKFLNCLVEGGWLIVSPTEASNALFPEFTSINFQGATFYRKGQGLEVRDEELKDEGRPFRWDEGRGTRDEIVHRPSEQSERSSSVPRQSERSERSSLVLRPLEVSEENTQAGKTPDPYKEALALYEKGSYPEAAEKLRPLLSQGPLEAKAAALLARIAANQGKLSEALGLCDRAVSADKSNPGNHYLLATIMQEQGRLQEAATELRKTIYLDQDFVLAHLLLGNLALRQGKRKESARHFRNAYNLLSRRQPEEIIPDAEGLTAGRLMEIIRATALGDGA
ncbi:MAG: tetratricopeptide repeat protein [Candidatus Tectomicrobia bacterium]|uniref:Tetratricopeptide repeat protein n=1 Tax=Tectimicrobiota bacterium TaxID=2528274 RepID=A0A933LQG3_UNCTE|nr:tetratricopeptide repeat protein [Candidatus Tectomicrobia bacterium]